MVAVVAVADGGVVGVLLAVVLMVVVIGLLSTHAYNWTECTY